MIFFVNYVMDGVPGFLAIDASPYWPYLHTTEEYFNRIQPMWQWAILRKCTITFVPYEIPVTK